MSANLFIRQSHRWLSIIFTGLVLANVLINTTGLGGEPLALTIGFTTLIPLVALMISGLYLFALPYLRGHRDSKTTE